MLSNDVCSRCNGSQIFTWNTDAWGFSSGTTSLYQSHPWVLAVLPDGKAFGVLADTARRCEVCLYLVGLLMEPPSYFPSCFKLNCLRSVC